MEPRICTEPAQYDGMQTCQDFGLTIDIDSLLKDVDVDGLFSLCVYIIDAFPVRYHARVRMDIHQCVREMNFCHALS